MEPTFHSELSFNDFSPSRFPFCLLYARTCRIHDKLISHKNKSLIVTNHTRDIETLETSDTEWFHQASLFQNSFKTVSKHSVFFLRQI